MGLTCCPNWLQQSSSNSEGQSSKVNRPFIHPATWRRVNAVYSARVRVRCGFSLVELLLVIIIIALLISILIPTITKARKQAAAVSCLANLRQCGQLIQIYSNVNNGKLLYLHWQNPTDWVGFYAWNEVLVRAKLVSTSAPGVLSCPLDGSNKYHPGRAFGVNFSGRYRNNPTSALLNPNVFANPWATYTFTKFEQSTEFVLLADAYDTAAFQTYYSPGDLHYPDHELHSWVTFRHDQFNGGIWLRHPQHTANSLFADMHAAPINEQEVKQLIHTNQPARYE